MTHRQIRDLTLWLLTVKLVIDIIGATTEYRMDLLDTQTEPARPDVGRNSDAKCLHQQRPSTRT